MQDLVSLMSSTLALHQGLKLVNDESKYPFRKIVQDDIETSCDRALDEYKKELAQAVSSYYASFGYEKESKRRRHDFEISMGYR